MLSNLLLYRQVCRQTENPCGPIDRQHFYEYSLQQIKREEDLRKDFSNYLHDDVLQDLLSVKNLLKRLTSHRCSSYCRKRFLNDVTPSARRCSPAIPLCPRA